MVIDSLSETADDTDNLIPQGSQVSTKLSALPTTLFNLALQLARPHCRHAPYQSSLASSPAMISALRAFSPHLVPMRLPVSLCASPKVVACHTVVVAPSLSRSYILSRCRGHGQSLARARAQS